MELALDLFQRFSIIENAGIDIDAELLFDYVVLHATARKFVAVHIRRNRAVALHERPEAVVLIIVAMNLPYGSVTHKGLLSVRTPSMYTKKMPTSGSTALRAAWPRLLRSAM
jgi:hypothetical protein